MLFHMRICHLYIFGGFFIVVLQGFFIYLDVGSLSDICFAKILSKSVTCLFILFNNVLHRASVLNFNVLSISFFYGLSFYCIMSIVNFGQFSAILNSNILLLIFLFLQTTPFIIVLWFLDILFFVFHPFFFSLLFRLQIFY